MGELAIRSSAIAPTIPVLEVESLNLQANLFLVASRSHVYGVRRAVLATLYEKVYSDRYNGISSSTDENTDWGLLYRIFECESRFNSTICNQQYGCGAGIGIGQLTAVAIKDCEKNLKMKIDPYNLENNIECSIWLYKTYGTKPWGCPTCEWGSYHCWGNQ